MSHCVKFQEVQSHESKKHLSFLAVLKKHSYNISEQQKFNIKKGCYVLHLDSQSKIDQRSIFSIHPNSFLSFREGFVAKKVGPGELHFYQMYKEQCYKVFPQDFVPEIYGIIFIKSINLNKNGLREVLFDFDPSLNVDFTERNGPPMLLQKDISAGFEKPTSIDIKLGTRSWALGAPAERIQKTQYNNKNSVGNITKFHIRAAVWYYNSNTLKNYNNLNNDLKGNIAKKDEMIYINKHFGKTCSIDQMVLVLKDIFKYPQLKTLMLEKIHKLKDALIVFRDLFDIRFYGSSLFFVYDDQNPNKFDVRLIDFEKSFFDIKKKSKAFNETLENCEDGIIEAIDNLCAIFKSL